MSLTLLIIQYIVCDVKHIITHNVSSDQSPITVTLHRAKALYEEDF